MSSLMISKTREIKKTTAIIFLVIVIIVELLAIIYLPKPGKEKVGIVTTSYVAYDFISHIVGKDMTVTLVSNISGDMHDYEPTPSDIKKISNAELFVYNGGESDSWASELLSDNDISESKTVKMMDFIDPIKEEDGEYDEHIWTSPVNAARIMEAIRDRILVKHQDKLDEYTKNTKEYVDEIMAIDSDIRDIVKNAKRKELVFADRFPFRYFVEEYGLKYTAAFPGCSDQTEASSSTIAELIRKVKLHNIPVVLKTEHSSDALARTVANEAGAKIATFNSMHSTSSIDYRSSDTYVNIWKSNLEVLRKALN